jgi:hypothetical protein
MRTAKTSGTSMTRSEGETRKTYAMLRVSGDSLDPDQVTRALRIVPTIAYRKGEKYFAGKRTGELVGRTGVWCLSTEEIVASDNLRHHLSHILGLLVPGRQDIDPLLRLHTVLARHDDLQALLCCFWHGRTGAKRPSIPKTVTEFLKLIPADIETDFATDSDEAERWRA